MSFYQQYQIESNFQQHLSSSEVALKNSTKKEQILVVDDTIANLQLISDFLRESQFEVRVAKSGVQALKIMETTQPDLILLDVVMPEMDGFETCRRLKDSPQTKDIPVIFMTAVDDASNPLYKVKGLELGAVDYISKPIQLQEVLARIKTHLQLRYLTQQLQQQKDLLESVFNQSADAIFLVNFETGLIADCNQRAVELFQATSKDELLNIQEESLQKHRFPPPELSSIWDEIEREGFWSREVEYVTKKGKLFWGNLAAKQIYVAGEKMNLVRVTDITDRKLAETREWEKSRQLKLALAELKRTQAQLILTEKMSSLGRMVAGIAHEINNPVSFIYGNIIPASRYFQEMLKLIELYQQTYPEPTPEIEAFVEDIDLGFVVEDFSKLMNSMQVGADRIQQIVLSLRNFSRLDEKEIKAVDIHEGIDSALLILQHRLKSKGSGQEIQVIKNYAQLPLVTCYASQLNEVFMNILINAMDFLEYQTSRVITISTSLIAKETAISNSQFVAIRIADNGTGMNEAVKKKIFDPFFTTKPVGSGTGLGLAISHEIVVEKHKGYINCISVLGQGTEFILEIPVKQVLTDRAKVRSFRMRVLCFDEDSHSERSNL
ncbi:MULTISPECIES: response regulator [unclassified Microcoleus]|uniref:hybrid sensor histidine kinase/response regulator n=1 Tax=unclassified Microcoleus TaxID=2642155 RepID=UPI002FD1D125